MPFTSWREYRENGTVTWESAQTNDLPLKSLNNLNEEELLSIKGIGPKTTEKLLFQLPVASLDELDVSKAALTALEKWLSE